MDIKKEKKLVMAISEAFKPEGMQIARTCCGEAEIPMYQTGANVFVTHSCGWCTCCTTKKCNLRIKKRYL